MAEESVQQILIELAGIRKDINVALAGQADHETRLRCLEGKPGKRWEDTITQILGLLVAAGVGLVLGKLF